MEHHDVGASSDGESGNPDGICRGMMMAASWDKLEADFDGHEECSIFWNWT